MSNYFYDKFSAYGRLVKATIKSDKLQWLKSIDNNLKTNPVHFWKYVSSFRKSDNNSVDLEVNGHHLSQPREDAEAFANYFKSVFNNPYLRDSSTSFQSSDSLSLAPVSDSDVFKAIKRLRPSKSVGIDNIPAFIIKGCSDIFVPVLKFIFNLSLCQRSFPNLWKQTAVIPVFKKGNRASVNNYRPMVSPNLISRSTAL